MPGLDPGILLVAAREDGRVKPGHDEMGESGAREMIQPILIPF